MSKHTSGPWEIVEPTKSYLQIIGGIDGDADEYGRARMTSTHICDVIDNQDEEANARLIAAAPELLKALKEAVQDCSCSVGERASGHQVDCCAPEWKELIVKVEGSPPAHTEDQ